MLWFIIGFLAGMGTLGALLIGLGIWATKDLNKEYEEARSRVS